MTCLDVSSLVFYTPVGYNGEREMLTREMFTRFTKEITLCIVNN